MKEILAVVLGGGEGTRLFPLTSSCAKPAVPLAGKYRLIDVPIAHCLNAGINRVFVLTQFNSAGLNHHISETYRFSSFDDGFVRVLAAEQTRQSKDWYRGTADAVRQMLAYLDAFPASHILILSGDQLYEMDLQAFFRHHIASEADLTIATTPVTLDEAPRFGIMHTDDDHRISFFKEKPSIAELPALESSVSQKLREAGRFFLASTGIYLFKKSLLRRLLLEHPEHLDFGKQVIPLALRASRVFSYPIEGYWNDVGSIGSYHEASVALTSSDPPIDLFSARCALVAPPMQLAPAHIRNSYIENVIASEGCQIIGSKIYDSILGPRTRINQRTTIRRSVILGAEYFGADDPVKRNPMGPANPGIGEGCYLEDVIADQNVSIGAGSLLANRDGVLEGEGEGYVIRDGIIVIPANTTLPAGTVIGASNRILNQELAPIEMSGTSYAVGSVVGAS